MRAVTDYEEEFCRFVPDAEIDDYHRRKTNDFDELVKMRGKLGKPFRFCPSCAKADRPLPPDGLSFVQFCIDFENYFEAGTRRPCLFTLD